MRREKAKRALPWALALLFVVAIIFGLLAGQYGTSLSRATFICLSCIGLE